MTSYLTVITAILIVMLLIGGLQIMNGRTRAAQILAIQLFGTLGAAILVLLTALQNQTAMLNVALVLAVLAPLTMIAFIHLSRKN